MSRKQQGSATTGKAKKKENAKTRAAQQAVTTQQTPSLKAASPPAPPKYEWPAAQQSYSGKGPYVFLNPYNFVRYLPEPKVDATKPDTILLGRCPPPPHDRYVGLSGTIHCDLEVVTPLFIADSEDIRVTNYRDEDGKLQEHLHYRFFQVAGQDMIPATSLRGAIRSLFEAVTNSCFSVFDRERILEYRADPSEGNKLKQNGGFVTKLATPQENGEITLCHVGTVAFYVEPTEKNRAEKKQNAIGVEREQWQNGDYVAARARQRKEEGGKKRKEEGGKKRKEGGWKIIEIARHLDELGECQPDKDGQLREKHVEGWLYITGKGEDTNKVNETFILDPQKHGDRGTISFSYAVQTEYNRIRQGQFERDELPIPLSMPRLTENEFVWIDLEGEGHQRIVKRLARVQVPRLPYSKSIGELLPPHLHPCQTYDALCPACRVFGWVKDAHLAGARHWSREELSAYAGRVRFSHATLVDGKDAGCFEGEIPLAILGSPKPTSVPFYLAKGDPDSPTFELPEGDRQAGYDSGYKLRGRKFYHHHGKLLNRQEFERADQKRDLQNRSVRNVRRPGNVFECTIHFENLAAVELGALLWTLTLGESEDCHLRLGYGKPLGFGSVQIAEVELTITDWVARYQTFANANTSTVEASTREGRRLISTTKAAFDQAMKAAYGQSVFTLPHMQDLSAILREPDPRWPPRIHYPRPPHPPHHQPNPDGKNFEWFEGNEKGKRSKGSGEKQGPFQALPQPGQMENGLPLIDKDGIVYKP